MLKDPSASRNHALLIVHSEGVQLKDLNSTNGTYVNNQRLTEDVPLSPGDRISIGQTEMVFGATEDALSSAAEVPAAVKPAEGERQEETSDDRVPTALGPTAAASEALDGNTTAGKISRSATTSVLPRESREAESARNAHEGESAVDETMGPGADNLGTPPEAGEAGTTAGTDDAVDEISVLDALEEESQPALPVPQAPASSPPLAEEARGAGGGELLPSLDLDAFDQELAVTDGGEAASSGSANAPAEAAASATASSTVSSTGGYRADSMVFSSGRQRAVTGPKLEPAGFGIRLAATLIDSLLLGLLGVGVYFGVGGPQSTGAATLSSLATSVAALLMLLFGWTLWGTTPGKRLFKLYIREEDGAKLGAGKAILRLLGYLASILALGLGFLMIAFTKGKRGLHDVIAGTYVGRA